MSIETPDILKSEQVKLAELRERREALAVDCECGREALRRQPRGGAKIQREALELLDGPADDDVELYDLDPRERALAVAEKAIAIQTARVQELGRQRAAEELERRRGEHAGLVDDICTAVESLRDALESEAAFRASFREHVNIVPQVTWRSYPWLRRVLSLQRGQFRRDQAARGFDV